MEKELELILKEIQRDKKVDLVAAFKEKVANGKIKEKDYEKKWKELKESLAQKLE